MKTCLYNFDSRKTSLLYSKTGVYRGIHYFSYFAKRHRLCVLIRTASLRQFLMRTHNLCFEQKYEKCQNFLSENFPFLVVKYSRAFVMKIYVVDTHKKRLAENILMSTHSFCYVKLNCSNYRIIIATVLGVPILRSLMV